MGFKDNKENHIHFSIHLDHLGQKSINLALSVSEVTTFYVVLGLHPPATLGIVQLQKK